MREPKVIIGAMLVCLVSALAPPLLNMLRSVFSGESIAFVYAYLSELQFLAASFFIILVMCRSCTAAIICRCGLLISYLFLVFLLIVSTRGLQVSKVEISLYTALILLTGTYVVHQLWIKTKRIENSLNAPVEQLGRTRYYNSGIQLIRQNAALAHSVHKSAFALLSPWGNGKTHFIQHIKANLQVELTLKKDGVYNGRFRTCEVSLWESKTLDEAWVNIINALYSTVTDSTKQNKISELPGTFFSLMLKLGGVFSSNLNNLGTIIEIVTEAGKYDIGSKASTIDDKLGEERALLILEDVDRADYEIIKGLLPLIERLKKISKLSIICSMDVEEVEKLYKSTQNIDEDTLRGYLFKVFDHTFLLPEMSVEMMEGKMQASAKSKYPECRLLNMFVEEIKLRYDTPRQMERMLDEWANIERNFFLIPAAIEIDNYTKEDAFVNFISKAMSICAPKKTKELLSSNDLLAEMKAMITTSYDSDGIKATMEETRPNDNSILMGSCLRFFEEHHTALRSFRDAVAQKYARRIDIKDWECADLIEKNKHHEIKGIFELLDTYFEDAPLENKRRTVAAWTLYNYAITRFVNTQIEVDRDQYYDFLIKVTSSLPTSYLIRKETADSPFTIPYDSFESCLGFLLLDRNKYQELLNLIFDKMSYHNQAIACLRLHLVYDSDSPEYFSRNNVSPILKLTYKKRNSALYKSIIQHYVHRYAARFCQYLVSPCPEDTVYTSSYVPYLCMEEKFAPSLGMFNDGISGWIKDNPEKKSKLASGFLLHLLTKVYRELSLDTPHVYIPKGISQSLPSIFALFDEVSSLTNDEQKEIRAAVRLVMPKLQEELQGDSDEMQFRNNSFLKGASEVIEHIQAIL